MGHAKGLGISPQLSSNGVLIDEEVAAKAGVLALKGAEQVLMHEVNAAEHNKALEKLAAGL